VLLESSNSAKDTNYFMDWCCCYDGCCSDRLNNKSLRYLFTLPSIIVEVMTPKLKLMSQSYVIFH